MSKKPKRSLRNYKLAPLLLLSAGLLGACAAIEPINSIAPSPVVSSFEWLRYKDGKCYREEGTNQNFFNRLFGQDTKVKLTETPCRNMDIMLTPDAMANLIIDQAAPSHTQ